MVTTMGGLSVSGMLSMLSDMTGEFMNVALLLADSLHDTHTTTSRHAVHPFLHVSRSSPTRKQTKYTTVFVTISLIYVMKL